MQKLILEVIRLRPEDVIATSGGVAHTHYARGGELNEANISIPDADRSKFYWVNYANNAVTGEPEDSGCSKFNPPSSGSYVWYNGSAWVDSNAAWVDSPIYSGNYDYDHWYVYNF